MGDTSKDILAILTQLLPGFLTAWVAYGLTNYTKPSQFERVIQALIYSFIVGAVVVLVEIGARAIGTYWVVLGAWNKDSEVVASAVVAIALGLLIARCSSTDWLFAKLRRFRLTARTPYPSEWYGSFAARPDRYVVLHLKGERRIVGFPEEWPTEPTRGHFRLRDAAWITSRGKYVALDADDESILLQVDQVEMVEFLKTQTERGQSGTEAAESVPTAAC